LKRNIPYGIKGEVMVVRALKRREQAALFHVFGALET
jgi:hypothetical protein